MHLVQKLRSLLRLPEEDEEEECRALKDEKREFTRIGRIGGHYYFLSLFHTLSDS